jgi:exodeoxyribonuclease VIII
VRKSPLHYLARRQAANDNAPTAAQAIGTAFHALILEPHLFAQQYTLGLRQSDFPDAIDGSEKLVALIEELNKGRLPKLATTGTLEELATRIYDAVPPDHRTVELQGFLGASKAKELKEHIAKLNEDRPGMLSVSGTIPILAQRLRDAGMAITLWSDIKAEWMRNNGHRNVLEAEEWDQLMNMREAVMAHPAARKLVEAPGRAEHSVYWIDKATGELCRCRPDKWLDNGVILDLKTTEDASPEGFAKSIANWAYDVQDPFYCDGIQAATGKAPRAFIFLAVEKGARVVEGQPLGVAVYQLDEASRELGRAKYREDLMVYSQCKKNDVWPCYGDKIQSISVPQWQFSKNAHLLNGTS